MLRYAVLALLVSTAIACGSSGSCGGCRRRARGAKTEVIDTEEGNVYGLSVWKEAAKNETYERLTNPNFLFHRCCDERNLPAACVNKCHFNAYNSDVLERMLVGTEDCPIEYLPEMQFCAAQGKDRTECCSSSGVGETLAGKKCLTFCDQRPDKYTPINYSYAPCFERFENMKTCFFDEIRSEAESVFQKGAESVFQKGAESVFQKEAESAEAGNNDF